MAGTRASPKRNNQSLLPAENIPEKMQKLPTMEQIRILEAQVYTNDEFKTKQQLLTGRAKLDPKLKIGLRKLDVNDRVDMENRLASVERGILILTKLTSDWDFNLIELKKIIQIVKESLPRGIGRKTVQSKIHFESIHRRMSVRNRASNWVEIQHATWRLMNEFPALETTGRNLMQSIVKNLKIRSRQDNSLNGLNWKSQMSRRLGKWDENKELY